MEGGTFRAINITAREIVGHALLEEAFNSWLDFEQPADILHVHYFQNPRAQLHGYQVIYRLGAREMASQHPSREMATFVV
jgi:hypothetical protein